jgi:nickel/cobalt transporter (NicO) family protein
MRGSVLALPGLLWVGWPLTWSDSTLARIAPVVGSWWYLDDDQLESVMLGLLEGTAWWLGVILALGAGALHAIGPGHGKTLVGAYLAGSRGRAGDAVALGALVAIMHTGSVLVVGMLFAATQQVPAGQRLEGILRLVSAAAVIAVGVWLFVRAWRQRRVTSTSDAGVDEPGSGDGPGRELGHEHGHHHHLPPEGVAPMSRAGIAAIASSGGLLPSPAAFLVLATAIAVGRTTYGLVLVGAFGLGLALTLTAVGVAVLWGRDRLAAVSGGRAARAVSVLPLVAAVVVMVGGGYLAVLAVRSL